MNRRALLRNVKMSTVAVVRMLDSGDRPFSIVGSGFCVDKNGIIVTCRHVMEAMMVETPLDLVDQVPLEDRAGDQWPLPPIEMYKPWVIFYRMDGAEEVVALPCEIVTTIAKVDYDLAVMKINRHVAYPDGFPCLDIEDYDRVCEGDEVGVCGFPLGNYLQDAIGAVTSSFTRGIISSILPAENAPIEKLLGYQLNVTATHGNSGGPVSSLSSGKVLGVLTRGVMNRKGELITGLVKAEPVYPAVDPGIIERVRKARPPQKP